MIAFLRRFWSQIALALAVVGGLLALVLGGRRRRPDLPPTPERPKLDDVLVPNVDTDVADDYAAGKEPVTTDADAVVDELNARHR